VSHDDGHNVLVRFHHVVEYSAKAMRIAITVSDLPGIWIPKSQIAHHDTETHEIWIPMWLAEKKGLEYE